MIEPADRLGSMPGADHNPRRRRLHLPIAGTVGASGGQAPVGEVPGDRPPWLRTTYRAGPNFAALKGIMRGRGLHTVCEEASCPNIYECWEEREATFLILGDTCTRRCGFCDVRTGRPDAVDEDEPSRVADAL